MNPLSGVGRQNSKDDYELPKEMDLINKSLPFEIFEYILSYLNDRDHLHSSLVNRLWNNATVDVAKKRASSNINHLIQFLIDHLNKETADSQIESLKGLQMDVSGISKKGNLLQVKRSTCESREGVLNIIKLLEDKEINSLAECSKDVKISVLFGDIFSLSRVYKKIEVADLIPFGGERGVALYDISITLLENDYIDKAIEVANIIAEGLSKEYALAAIFKALMQKGKTGEALRNISEALMQNSDIDKAIEVANTIILDGVRGVALHIISKVLTQSEHIDKAIEVANTIPCELERGFALQDISKALTQNGRIDKAIEIANLVPHAGSRKYALQNIFEALTQSGYIDKAIEVATLISDEAKREYAPRKKRIRS